MLSPPFACLDINLSKTLGTYIILAFFASGPFHINPISASNGVFTPCPDQHFFDRSGQIQVMDTDSVQSKLYRRFTTIEGWREVGHGVYVAAGSTISAIAFDRNPEHGPEWPVYDDDSSQTTRMSKPDRQRLALMRLEGQGSVHPWGESRSLYANEPAVPETALQNPFMPPQNPFMAPEELEQAQASEQRDNVGAGGIFVPAPDPSAPTEKPAPAEKPFHIFDKKKKWTVVITIGMAGLFSGLSSNIYFPSLDAIAKVSTSNQHNETNADMWSRT